MKKHQLVRVLCICIVTLLIAAAVISCDLNINVDITPPPPEKHEPTRMTVALCEPSMPPSVEEDHFYAHDEKGTFFRIKWNSTAELYEGATVLVQFDSAKKLSYENGYPSGWTPAYEVTATSVELNLPFDLPDFKVEEEWSFGWGAYQRSYAPDTPHESVQNYVQSLEDEGFTCYHVSPKENDPYLRHAYLLYRDNITILIEKTEYSCTLRYHISTPPQENDGTPNPFPSPASEEVLAQLNHEKAIYAFEVTPRELYNATGARLYEVVSRELASWGHYSSFDSLQTDLVLVGENGVLPMHSLCPGEMHFRDTDGNGITELLYISAGYTSGIYSEIINILEMQDGVPTEKAVEMVSMQSYAFVTDADGNLLLRRTVTGSDLLPVHADYRFTVEDGNIIFHPIDETAPGEFDQPTQ